MKEERLFGVDEVLIEQEPRGCGDFGNERGYAVDSFGNLVGLRGHSGFLFHR
jgi:hypothetical protein